MTTGVKWVKMTTEEYEEYKRRASTLINAFEDGYKHGKADGYEVGYNDAQYFFRSYSPEELELENDEN